MIKVGGDRRAAARLSQFLLVCSLFAIGLAPSARADGFQYTVTFDPSNSTGLYTSFSFETTSLLGSTTTNIDPSDVQVLTAPRQGASIDGFLTASSGSFAVAWLTQGPNPSCLGFNCSFTTDFGSFLTPITSPGTYQFDFIEITDQVVGGGQVLQFVSPKDPLLKGSVTLVATPEPSTGSMFGACLLLCAAVALRWEIRSPLRTIPRVP